MQNKRKIEEYRSWYQQTAALDKLWVLPAADALVFPEGYVLAPGIEITAQCQQVLSWLRNNLYGRQFKQKQLYLWGPANLGKTSLVRTLATCLATYHAPMEENFFDLYDEETHQLVCFDEFKGQHPLTFMNAFLQGDTMSLRKKGSQYLKTKNLPTIILSNYSPRDAYSKVSEEKLDTFLVRLEVVELTSPIFALVDFLQEQIEC